MKRRLNGYWNASTIDDAFDLLKEKLGRTPKTAEFMKSYGGALNSIRIGKYSPEIKTWRQYLEHKGLNASRIAWTPKKVDEAFDELSKELGRVPRYNDFMSKYGGAVHGIKEGRYSSNVKTWNQYLQHRGLDLNRITNCFWNPKNVDKVFDKLLRELRKIPLYDDFTKMHGGALKLIESGKYSPKIRTWNDYLKHRGYEVNQGRNVWNPKNVDKAFDKLSKELRRTPRQIEFKQANSGALLAIIRGRYSSRIKTWNEYLEYRRLEVYGWSPEKVDEAFDSLVKELGRVPTCRLFGAKHGGALGAIIQGRYSSQITKWSEYVAYRQNGNKSADEREQVQSLLEGYVDDC